MEERKSSCLDSSKSRSEGSAEKGECGDGKAMITVVSNGGRVSVTLLDTCQFVGIGYMGCL